jgi:vacuolar protein sorting-associated protein 16
LISVNRYSEPRPQKLAAPGVEDQIISWTIIAPENTLSKAVEVLLAINNTIYLVDTSDAEDRMLQRGPFHHISVSPSGRLVALYTKDGKVWVVSSDFQNRYSEHDTKSRVMPRDMQWCGDDAVVLAWEDEVHLIGPNGASSEFYYDSWVHLLPELDGVRLITNDVCEFWQKIPAPTEETFKLGSTAPSAVLLDALDHLERKSPKADDNIQLIRSNLDEAVETCVKAAGQEFDVHWQKQLLKAASYGKSVLDLFNSDEFVDMCETLRVLNAVRFYEIGLPLSYDQYHKLGPENLVQRLINRDEYLVALRISEYLQLPTDKVYVHWASQKVRVSTDDEETICRLIVQKLSGKKGVSFEEIARTAHDEGRSALATELLNYELRAGKQVPLLLSMKEDSVALDKAIESGDTDLVFFVLLTLKQKLPLASFFRMINSRPVATALVEASALEDDTEMLKDLYYQDDRPLDSANIFLMDSLKAHDVSAKQSKLYEAARLLKDSKEYAFQAKATEDTQKLLKLQESLDKERDSAGGYVGLSINQTIFKLVLNANTKKATKIQSDFKVPDKTFWWLRLRALVAARNWTELEEVSKTKKSPIDWEVSPVAFLDAGSYLAMTS